MFFGKLFINEDNISSIKFFEYNSTRKFRVKKVYSPEEASTHYWRTEDDEDRFYLLDNNGDTIKNIKFNSDEEFGIEDKPEQKKENDMYRLIENSPDVAEYESKSGHVEVTIAMNNGDKHNRDIIRWGEIKIFRDGKAQPYKDVKKPYDGEMTIQKVYEFLKKGSISKDKVMI